MRAGPARFRFALTEGRALYETVTRPKMSCHQEEALGRDHRGVGWLRAR